MGNQKPSIKEARQCDI